MKVFLVGLLAVVAVQVVSSNPIYDNSCLPPAPLPLPLPSPCGCGSLLPSPCGCGSPLPSPCGCGSPLAGPILEHEEDVYFNRQGCGCGEPRANVFVHSSKPIIVSANARHVEVQPESPLVIKTKPVLIHRRGNVRVEPRIVKFRPRPLVLTERIVKVVRPVHKKVFVEQCVRKENPCQDQIIQRRLIRHDDGCEYNGHDFPPCNCPVA